MTSDEIQQPITLTGIKPTGESIHLGNEVGMGLTQITSEDFVFIADAHALTGSEKSQIPEWSASLTAQLLAINCKGIIYRQSDVPEVFQLYWLLANVIHCGHMERMHTWKANDGNINVGAYTYPILMAADIILVGARYVRVGQDQLQHIEVARILAERAIREYKLDNIILPDALLSTMPILPGIDGRKMSKSYQNTIPIICARDELRALVFKVVTDSTPPTAPKAPETLYQLYAAFASLEEIQDLTEKYAHGISWRDVKELVFEKIWDHIKERKLEINYTEIAGVWKKGAAIVRERAQKLLEQMRRVY